MRTVAVPLALTVILLASPAVAADSGQQESSSGGIFDWLVNTVSGSQSADQTLDEKKQAQSNEADKTAEPQPMAVPDDGMPDKDSYKPDAGDAPQ